MLNCQRQIHSVRRPRARPIVVRAIAAFIAGAIVVAAGGALYFPVAVLLGAITGTLALSAP